MAAIREEPIDDLRRQGEIVIAFEVATVLELALVDAGLGGIVLAEQPVDAPWVKDHDAADGGPQGWASRFDVASWGLLGAYDDGRRIGGAVIAFDTPDLHRLRGRRDLAVLWDLRVAQDARRSGAGTALFRAAEAWARERAPPSRSRPSRSTCLRVASTRTWAAHSALSTGTRMGSSQTRRS